MSEESTHMAGVTYKKHLERMREREHHANNRNRITRIKYDSEGCMYVVQDTY